MVHRPANERWTAAASTNESCSVKSADGVNVQFSRSQPRSLAIVDRIWVRISTAFERRRSHEAMVHFRRLEKTHNIVAKRNLESTKKLPASLPGHASP